MRVLVTGGAGFIGAALVRLLVASGHDVLNLDALTYAANPAALAEVADSPHYRFVHADVGNAAAVGAAIADFRPTAIAHLAAETHVDRSLDAPAAFVAGNVVGTFTLLGEALAYQRTLRGEAAARFRFLHVSTDEVFGSLGADGRFDETSRYDPRSPYAASKAAADHFVRAWGHSFGLPAIVAHPTNNYGPWAFPEKLIPLTVLRALRGLELPVYGDGGNIRDWLFVDDHARALALLLESGVAGESYAIGGDAERRNIDVVRTICAILDGMVARPDGRAHAEQIRFVADRPGHDRRYALDSGRIRETLGWVPETDFETGLAGTVRWYVEHRDWWDRQLRQRYDLARLGLAVAR